MFGNLFSRKKEKAAWLELAEELNMPKDVVKALAALRPVEKDPGLDEYIEGLGNLAIPGEAENAEAGLEMALGRDPHHYKLLHGLRERNTKGSCAFQTRFFWIPWAAFAGL